MKRIRYAEKAEKGQPYIRLTFFDGTSSVICGKLCDLLYMIRVNRAVVVSPDAAYIIEGKWLHVLRGPSFCFSRRMLKGWRDTYRPTFGDNKALILEHG
jgi:hypothetical protein